MLGILRKDFSLMVSSKQTMMLLLLYIPLLLFVAESFVPEHLYFMIIVFYTYIMAITSFTYDISGKSKYIVNSLPISRKEFVLYKYLSIFVYLAVTIVYAGVYLWIISTLNLANVDYFNLRGIINAVPTVMIFASIVFPAYIRFEPKIAQIIHMVVFMTFFIVCSNISYVGEEGVLKYLGILKWEQVMLVALVLYMVSLLLSIKLYENRDL